MLAKHIGALVLIFAVLLDAAVLLTLSNPWYRLAMGLMILVPIILAAASAEVTKTIQRWMGVAQKLRRYHALRSKTSAFLSEVRRLNWMVVDSERGFADPDAVASDIEACKERMEELFGKIVEAAGRPGIGLEDEEEEEAESAPRLVVDEEAASAS
jgi:hypothetical protein